MNNKMICIKISKTTQVQVPMKNHVFYISKSCLLLEDALGSSSSFTMSVLHFNQSTMVVSIKSIYSGYWFIN